MPADTSERTLPESLRAEAGRRGVSLYKVRTERAQAEGLSKSVGAGKARKGERPLKAVRQGQRARALARLRRLSRTGARARFRGKVAKDTPGKGPQGQPLDAEYRTRTIPPRKGYPLGVEIEPAALPSPTGEKMHDVLELAKAGEWAEAAEQFFDAILTDYADGLEGVDLGNIEWLDIWEPSEDDPREDDD
jgi:hypothetical protein